MSLRSQVSCIIPFWNEGFALFSVLKEVSKAKNIAEIICVDDGSNDRNFLVIRKRYPHIRVIRLEQNQGKTGAVREGLKSAKGEFIFLLDADLRNLNHHEIEMAAAAITSAHYIDMLILRRINAIFFVRFSRADILFTGERILRKTDLQTIINNSNVKGWQLESAINTWMYKNQKNVCWMPHSGINKQKYLKWGFYTGLKLDLKTYSDMITASGFNNLVKQIFFFARNEFKPEFKEVLRG
ncbi:MAG TPA: glycosyltransferase [Bacteroidales bacterium]|nr:glycosyltransferase [Bacteroidales bacterium]